MCFADWSTHGSSTGGYFTCNIFKRAVEKGDLKGELKDIADAINQRMAREEESRRYQHHVDRFRGSLQAAHAASTTSMEKMHVTMAEVASLIKGVDASTRVAVLEEALSSLAESRRVLAYTYIDAYYLDAKPATEKELFLFLQRDLEGGCGCVCVCLVSHALRLQSESPHCVAIHSEHGPPAGADRTEAD